MPCIERLESLLRQESVPFQVQHHPLAYTAQQLAAAEHVPGRMIAKVVMVYADGQPAMLVMPAPAHVNLMRAALALKVREVRLAREEEFARQFPDCEVGAMPPFGNLYGVPVWIDKSLAKDDTIIFAAGTHTDTIQVAFSDFERIVKPIVGDFAYVS